MLQKIFCLFCQLKKFVKRIYHTFNLLKKNVKQRNEWRTKRKVLFVNEWDFHCLFRGLWCWLMLFTFFSRRVRKAREVNNFKRGFIRDRKSIFSVCHHPHHQAVVFCHSCFKWFYLINFQEQLLYFSHKKFFLLYPVVEKSIQCWNVG